MKNKIPFPTAFQSPLPPELLPNFDDLLEHELFCITTNVGWTCTGENTMGRGLAHRVGRKKPKLSRWYGAWSRQWATSSNDDTERYAPVARFPDSDIICFPTKPLNRAEPQTSWMQQTDVDQIKYSATSLMNYIKLIKIKRKVFLPFQAQDLSLEVMQEIIRPIISDQIILMPEPT